MVECLRKVAQAVITADPRLAARRALFSFLLATVILVGARSGRAGNEPAPQDKILGLYLYNFLLFVDWPEGSFRNRYALEIGLLSETQGGADFFAGIAGRQLRERTLMIQRIRRAKEVDRGWQVLFIQEASPSTVRDILGKVDSAPCLTVSNVPGFTDLGGMVEFLPIRTLPPVGSRDLSTRPAPRFRINLEAVLRAELKIRSRLLRLSEITGADPNGVFKRR